MMKAWRGLSVWRRVIIIAVLTLVLSGAVMVILFATGVFCFGPRLNQVDPAVVMALGIYALLALATGAAKLLLIIAPYLRKWLAALFRVLLCLGGGLFWGLRACGRWVFSHTLLPVGEFFAAFFPPFSLCDLSRSSAFYPVLLSENTLFFKGRIIPVGFKGLVRAPWIVLCSLPDLWDVPDFREVL